MSDTPDIEDLKKRKEQLLLEKQIASLERHKQLRKAGEWSWKWVAPLALLGAWLLIAAADERSPAILIIALLALAPITIKLYFKR
ncbi:hypothetical protein [Alcaligenes phenolicus]|uniref:hypothetical protein n=1 Tax=Alcaligenes phenolicus TaxID=232846 RepID=UPI002AA7B1FF|nr:hypothetical protein [Alcaligenes phenolicus]